MVTAILTHRIYVDDMTLAIKFSRLQFNGMYYIEEILEKIEHLITNDKYYMQETIIDFYDSKKKEIKKSIEALNNKIKKMKRTKNFHALFGENQTKIKQIRQKIKEFEQKIIIINEKVKVLENDLFYSAEEVLEIHRKLLCTLNFTCKGTSHLQETSVSMEVYENTLSDEELIEKGTEMCERVEKSLNQKIEQLKKVLEKKDEENIR